MYTKLIAVMMLLIAMLTSTVGTAVADRDPQPFPPPVPDPKAWCNKDGHVCTLVCVRHDIKGDDRDPNVSVATSIDNEHRAKLPHWMWVHGLPTGQWVINFLKAHEGSYYYMEYVWAGICAPYSVYMRTFDPPPPFGGIAVTGH